MSEYIIEVQAGASQGALAVAGSSVITRTSNNIWRLTPKRSQNDKWVQIFCGSSILQSSSLKMERKCQQSCCKNPKNKSNFWLKLKDMLQINPEKRYLTPQLMFLPPSLWSITKTLPIVCLFVFCHFLSGRGTMVIIYQSDWQQSTMTPLQSSFPCRTEGSEFAPAALKVSVMRRALRWEETRWEPRPVPICCL